MSTENSVMDGEAGQTIKTASPLKNLFPLIVLVIAAILAFAIFYKVLGNPANFEGNDPENHPINFFGTIFKGGIIVPLGLTTLILMLTFIIERAISLLLASGRGSIDVFVQKVRQSLHKGDIQAAIEECDRHRSSVANVIKSGLKKYLELGKNSNMDMDQKKAALEAEIEEAISLEIPSLQKNLPWLALIVSAGVLIGLLGTVMGMIKAFSAMANAGAPDAGQLATGISEALVNTAIGIFNSLLSLVFYTIFTNMIDGMTYRMDEAKYSIIQSFESTHK